MKILVLYFSGAGATKKVAELIFAKLVQDFEADMFSVENGSIFNREHYDALIIGTPVYHGAPARIIMDYVNAIPALSKDMPAFIYNTSGMYSFNTNRILAKKLLDKNIYTIMDRSYRGPASDGAILAPFIKRFFEFEKGIEKKVDDDCKKFLEMLSNGIVQSYIPKFNLLSVLNAPNKAAGQFITLKIHVHKDECIKCGLCIANCPHSAVLVSRNGYPLFEPSSCENCYRCIHHCPKAALSLSKRQKLKKLLPKN